MLENTKRIDRSKSFLQKYPLIQGIRVFSDACNIDPLLVSEMPAGTTAEYNVEMPNGAGKHIVSVDKFEQSPYKQVVRIMTGDGKYKMEAAVFDPDFFPVVFGNTPFEVLITQESKILKFNLFAKVGEEHHPVIRAKRFVPWAYSVFADEGIDFLFADFFPGSDTFEAYMQELNANGGNEIEAMKKSHPYPLYTALGFDLIPIIYNVESQNSGVYALYKKRKN